MRSGRKAPGGFEGGNSIHIIKRISSLILDYLKSDKFPNLSQGCSTGIRTWFVYIRVRLSVFVLLRWACQSLR